MPQKLCSVCVDKINDFYEYRQMCKQTDAQTRSLLGLPPEIKEEELSEPKISNKKKRVKVGDWFDIFFF